MFDDARNMASGFSVGTATSTNVIDMGTADSDEMDPAEVRVDIIGGVSVSNTGTVQVVLQESASSGGSYVTIQSGRVSSGNAANFNPFRMKVPPKHLPFLRLQFVVATNNFSAGTLHAGIV
jgi:hypothetical protein